MFEASSVRFTLPLICAVLLASAMGCNFSDPVASLPVSGCADESDCNDNGTCDVQNGQGVCICAPGYEGNTCRDCAEGYISMGGECVDQTVTNNGTNNGTTASNNGTTGECEEGEYLEGDQCLIDGCADNPCGDGTCTQLGDNLWSCQCPNGTNGIECPRCADGCVNGTCNADSVCECDQGWGGTSCSSCAPGYAGANCDTCAPNAFGPNCDTCATIGEAEPWWNTSYGARQGIIVFNPGSSSRAVQDGMIVRHTFDHEDLVQAGASSRGDDVRIVAAPDQELDRVLGFDSNWDLPDTTVWFPVASALNPGEFDVYYLYANNPAPDAVLNDVTNITRVDRSWFQANGNLLYRPHALNLNEIGGAAMALQIRQKDLTTVEAVFIDQSDTTGASIVVRFVNPSTNTQVASATFSGDMGSSTNPSVQREELSLTNNALRLDVEINSGQSSTDVTQIYLGGSVVQSSSGARTYQTTLSRSPHNSALPEMFVCAPEMQ